MTAIGFDPTRGGNDKSTAARRHDTWFDELISVPGAVVKDGPTAAGFIVPLVRNGDLHRLSGTPLRRGGGDPLLPVVFALLPVAAALLGGALRGLLCGLLARSRLG